ncbi:MAG TPA: zinc ribbon domain-containing protein [Mobilitalea sp.]|nr:zinc ribbon domain-containing protein [Mobilitalea sp.]
MSKISKQRKVTYYIGMGMIVVGVIVFISTFFTFGDIMNNPAKGFGSFTSKPIIGMILMIAGAAVSKVGARGAAGSGLMLDPDQAREDLKPFNEAKGGMINDVISNIDVLDRFTESHDEKEIIKIRCQSCGGLNDEDAKFCKGCGKEI